MRSCAGPRVDGGFIFVDGPVTTHQCPVRSLTPEVQRWITLFDLTHEIDETGVRRIALPFSGGAAEQPVKDMSAFGVIARTTYQILEEEQRRQRRKKGTRKKK